MRARVETAVALTITFLTFAYLGALTLGLVNVTVT